jgi:plasmid maintenance system antidote protein VapI
MSKDKDGSAKPETYSPGRLLDTLIARLQLKNDAELSRVLYIPPYLISKMRRGRVPVGASTLIRMNEITGLTIQELRNILGDRRARHRFSDSEGKPHSADDRHSAAKKSA